MTYKTSQSYWTQFALFDTHTGKIGEKLPSIVLPVFYTDEIIYLKKHINVTLKYEIIEG